MSSNKADQSPKPASRPRVLVLGGGFAGIGAARKLRKADVDVVVIDGHDYHTFQPLLYQVATDLLPQGTVGHPLRDLFDDQPNARVHTTGVTSVDLDKHEVGFAEMDPLEYDYLVLALGAEVNFFGGQGGGRACLPAVHAGGRGTPQGAHSRTVGGGRQGPGPNGGRRAERRRGRRRAD